MGSDESKPEQQEIPADVDPQNQNHFFVEEIEKVNLKNRRQVSYYWIDPKVYNAENQKYYNQFLAHFKIQSFTSLQALRSELDQIQNNELIKVITAASLDDNDYRQLQNQPKVAQLFLFCGNQERAKLLCKNFTKIKGYALKSPQMIELLKKFELEDKLDIPPCSLLCMLQEDRKVLNRYRLNYFCITTKHHKNKSKLDFITLSKALVPDQQEKIEKFQREYNIQLNGSDAYSQSLQWAFQDSFYWKMIQNLPKATTDPKKLAYLRLPFYDLFQAIFQKKVQKSPEELYIVTQLNLQEINKLRDHGTLDNFVIFTSFVKGFTKKADAIKQFKENQRSFLFQVTFTDRKRESKLDFGFVIAEDKTIKKNVLFNIYNFFQLEALEPEKRTGTLIYGPLAEAFHNRADQTSKKRLTQNEAILLRNFDYIQEIIRRDNSQAVILQISGYFKQSLEIYDRKVEYLRKTKAPQSELVKYIILRGDSYRMNQDFEQAEKDYRSVTNQDYKIVAMVHLLELYLRKGDERQAQVLEQLEQPTVMRKLKQKYPEEGFKAQNFIAVQWMRQGRYKEALKKYKNLQSQATIYFQYRFQGIPIVHDIFRNMATCEAKLNNHKEALNLLTSTKDWQLVCEGESAGLALTQTMIQCVHEQIGNQESARETADSLQHLTQNINLQQKRYLNQSTVSISMGLRQPKNINNSGVNINMNPVNVNNSGVNINMNPVNVNTSAVNVNMNPINVNNSMVNVNLNPNVANINNSAVKIQMSGQKPKPPVNINNSSVDIQL